MSGFNNVIFSRTHYTPHYSTPYRIERVTIHLKDLDTTATIYPIFNINQAPHNLIKFLHQEYNDEILRGDTLPFFDKLTFEEFQNYWFGQFAAVMCIGEKPELDEDISVNEWAKLCLGSFFIKSAYPGRCSHICTTNFLVNAGIRRRGIGFYLCECFLRWAPVLGYSRCIVDLVFETNFGIKRLLEKCGFSKVGKVNSCAMLKSTKDVLIGSYIFNKELSILEEDVSTSKHANILRYLVTGQYPEGSSKEDRSRLRSLAYHYEAVNNKLYLKGKQVIYDVDEQYKIVKDIHDKEHWGINKTTAYVSNKYYWAKVKLTVRKVVNECPVCIQLAAEKAKSRRKRPSQSKNASTLSTQLNKSENIEINNNSNNDSENNRNDNDDDNNKDTVDIDAANRSRFNQYNNTDVLENDKTSTQGGISSDILPHENSLMNYINLQRTSTYHSTKNVGSTSSPHSNSKYNSVAFNNLNDSNFSGNENNNNNHVNNTLNRSMNTNAPISRSMTPSQDFVSLLNYYNTASNMRQSMESSGTLYRDKEVMNNNPNNIEEVARKRSRMMAFGTDDNFEIDETGPSTTEDPPEHISMMDSTSNTNNNDANNTAGNTDSNRFNLFTNDSNILHANEDDYDEEEEEEEEEEDGDYEYDLEEEDVEDDDEEEEDEEDVEDVEGDGGLYDLSGADQEAGYMVYPTNRPD